MAEERHDPRNNEVLLEHFNVYSEERDNLILGMDFLSKLMSNFTGRAYTGMKMNTLFARHNMLSANYHPPEGFEESSIKTPSVTIYPYYRMVNSFFTTCYEPGEDRVLIFNQAKKWTPGDMNTFRFEVSEEYLLDKLRILTESYRNRISSKITHLRGEYYILARNHYEAAYRRIIDTIALIDYEYERLGILNR